MSDNTAGLGGRFYKQAIKDLRQAFESQKKSLEDKVDKSEGKGLSANDYTDADKASVGKWNEASGQFGKLGYYIIDNGIYAASTSYMTSGMLVLNRNHDIELLCTAQGAASSVAFFASDKSFISARQLGRDPVVIAKEDFPADAVFVAFATVNTPEWLAKSYYRNGPTLENRENAVVEALAAKLEKSEWDKERGLFNSYGHVRPDSGVVVYNASVKNSGFIPLDRDVNLTVYTRGWSGGYSSVVFYGASLNFLKHVEVNDSADFREYTIAAADFPQGAAFFLVTTLAANFQYAWYDNGGTIEARGNATANAIAESKLAMLIELTKGDGVVYNASTGFFELNGLTDITYDQMLRIYPLLVAGRTTGDMTCRFQGMNARTITVHQKTGGAQAAASLAFYTSTFEVIKFDPSQNTNVRLKQDINDCFRYCIYLREVIGELDVSAITRPINMTYGCTKLEHISLTGLKVRIDFATSPLLSQESLSYLVANAANTEAITVTVHPDVYARLTDETNEEWHKVLTDGVAKNIAFATTE